MKAYGVKHQGPVCKWGCCYVQTTQTGPKRKYRHGLRSVNKKRARRNSKRAISEQRG